MENSACNFEFEEANQRVKNLSEMISLIAFKVIPIGSVTPSFLGSFFVYFSTDKGNDAFELPVPMW